MSLHELFIETPRQDNVSRVEQNQPAQDAKELAEPKALISTLHALTDWSNALLGIRASSEYCPSKLYNITDGPVQNYYEKKRTLVAFPGIFLSQPHSMSA